jgi:hypothetical protein
MNDVILVSVVVSRETDLVSSELHRADLSFLNEQASAEYQERLAAWLEIRPEPVVDPDPTPEQEEDWRRFVADADAYVGRFPLIQAIDPEAELDRILDIFRADDGLLKERRIAPVVSGRPFDQEVDR